MTQIRTLSALLTDLQNAFEGKDAVRIGDILEGFHERGFGFFLFLFALPAALPLPAAGYGTILAFPLLFLSAQCAIGRHTIWFPARIKTKTIKSAHFIGTIDKAVPWMRRLEILVRPRLGVITRGVASNIVGACAFIMALSVLLPIPLTNTVPSLGIALMSVGLIMRDGLAVLAGAIIGIMWVCALVGFTLYFGAEGLEIFKNMIKSLL